MSEMEAVTYDPTSAMDSSEAIELFMADAFETGNSAYIAKALGVVARAKGMTQIANDTGLSREQFYRPFLHAATCLDDIDKPGYRLHALQGKLKEHWAIMVSGNWRIVFRFEDGDAYVVNYEDYH